MTENANPPLPPGLNRPQKLFYSMRLFSSVADYTLGFTVPLMVFAETKSLSKSALTYFFQWLPRLFSLPISGALSDRWGSIRLIRIADFIRFVAVCFCFLFMKLGFVGIGPLLITVAVCSYFGSQMTVSLESHLATTLPPQEFVKAQSVLQAIDQLSILTGPALAGIVIEMAGHRAVIALASIGYLFSFLNSSRIALGPSKGPSQIKWREDMFKVGKFIWSNSRLCKLILATSTLNFALGVVFSTSIPIVKTSFGVTDAQVSLMQSLTAAVGIGVFLLTNAVFKGRKADLQGMIALGIMILGIIFLNLSRSFPGFVLGYVLSTGLIGLYNVFIRSERARLIGSERVGKTIGLIIFLNQLTLPLSALVVSALGSIFPGPTLFAILSLSSTALLIILSFNIFSRTKNEHPYSQQNSI